METLTDGDNRVETVNDHNADGTKDAKDLILEQRLYDVFGTARPSTDYSANTDSWMREGITSHGFTGHEHLLSGLIHMNGRAYDPALGRFLSVDPFIAMPENGQSINPYSYVMNNPLKYTDPSGYISMFGGSIRDAFFTKRAKQTAPVNDSGSKQNKNEESKKEENKNKVVGNGAGQSDNSTPNLQQGGNANGHEVSTNVENDSSLTAARNMAGQPKNNLTAEEKFFSGVIQPTLKKLGINDPDAEVLLLATAIHESHLTMRDQMGNGPAKGLYQMEPATHDDIWNNYLKYKPKLAAKVKGLLNSNNKLSELRSNDAYATAMAYVHYDRARFRTGQAFPGGTNIQGMAQYWKKHYNTSRGKGTVTKFVNDWWNATSKP